MSEGRQPESLGETRGGGLERRHEDSWSRREEARGLERRQGDSE